MKLLDGFRQRISIFKDKRINLFLLMYIILANIIILLLGGTAGYFLSDGYYNNIFEAVWDSFKYIIEPGFLAENVNDGVRYLSAFMIVIGMIVFTGGTIGYITNKIDSIIEKTENNKGKLFLRNHIIVLNWNKHALDILTEYFLNDHEDHVLILTDQNPDEIENEIDGKIYEEKYNRIKGRLNWFVREGDVTSLSDLDKIYYKESKAILILTDDQNDSKGLNAIKTLMLLSKEVMNKTIVVETKNQHFERLVEKIKSHDQNNTIIGIPIEKILGKLIGQIVIHPNLSLVYNELLTYNGAEIYTVPTIHKKMNYNILSLIEKHDKAVPIDIKDGQIYWLAESMKDVFSTRRRFKKQEISFKQYHPELNKKNILIFGDSNKLGHIFDTMNAYSRKMDENVFNVTHSHGVEKHIDNKNQYEQIDFSKNIYNTSDIYQQLKGEIKIDEMYDTILILSEETSDEYSTDTNALLYLLHMVYLMDEDWLNKTSVIIELLNSKHDPIARRYNENSVVIISNKYIAKLLAQLSNKQTTFNFFQDVFYYQDQNLNEKFGNEIYILSCSDILEDLPLKTISSNLIYNVKEKLDSIVLGVIDDNHTMLPLFKGKLDKKIELTSNSKLILYTKGVEVFDLNPNDNS
ncbi:hypothetical protein [Haloplasma contractile]|uniref:Uncharacterized protein n=1 Tax=Haloplasma contractile SSD-17B TaxID=1033810 RepID=F7PZL4_9MOLU|nr:hypothetical protein [Haloplasma contractile]ERJ13301.1 hypothetical protein HLPCO_000930 [Haloplasma contractile SSD-17B]